MPLKYISLLLLSLTSLSGLVKAQQLTYTVDNYGLDDGLPSNRIFSLIQHSSGFVYVGTVQGLHRFDGRGFIPMVDVNGSELITRGTIFRGCETKEGKLLLMSSLTGITAMDGHTLIFDPFTESVDSISLEEFNTMWDESQKYHSKIAAHRIDDGIAHTMGYTFFEDAYGNHLQLKGTMQHKGSALLTLSTGEKMDLTAVLSTLVMIGQPTSFNLGDVMYFGGHNGLLKIAIHKSPFQLFLHEEGENWEYLKMCRAMAIIGQDSILASVEREGVYLIDVAHGRSSEAKFKPEDLGEGMKTQFFRYLWNDSNRHELIGPHLMDVFSLDVKKMTASKLTTTHKEILAGAVLNNSMYLLARRVTDSEAYFFELVDKKSGNVRTIEFQNGEDIISKKMPTYIEVVADTSVWYGTQSGLFHLDIKNRKIKHLFLGMKDKKETYPFPVSYSLTESHVWVMDATDDGKLWMGMQATGINVLDTRTLKMAYFSIQNGLSNNTVVSLLPDDHGYWIGTFNGLSYLDTATMNFRNFYRSNGISHNEFNRHSFLIDDSGRYFLGTMNGITSFYPEDVLRRDEKQTLLVSEIRTYRKNGIENLITNYAFKPQQIVIPSRIRNLSVKMTLADNNNPKANTFFYKLVSDKPYDEVPWKSLGTNNEIKFENLGAGHFQLILRGASAAGVSSNEVIIPLQVYELFYRTWWFFSLAVLSVAFLTFVFFRMRLKQALHIERLRTRLSSDLHDDVGGLLSGVAFQMEALEHRVDPKLRPQIAQVAKSSRKAMERMRDTVWAIDARRQTIGDLRDRMLESCSELLEPLDISYVIDISSFASTTILTAEVRHNLLLIFKEFINNTIKHAAATAVEVRFIKKGKELKMEMMDNGIGMSPDSEKRTGQGLKNMKMRTEKIGGEITFINNNGFGVIVFVPL